MDCFGRSTRNQGSLPVRVLEITFLHHTIWINVVWLLLFFFYFFPFPLQTKLLVKLLPSFREKEKHFSMLGRSSRSRKMLVMIGGKIIVVDHMTIMREGVFAGNFVNYGEE